MALYFSTLPSVACFTEVHSRVPWDASALAKSHLACELLDILLGYSGSQLV
jgi:hypothetical protein